MLKSTGGTWAGLSDTKKGIAAIFGAVIVGFSIGTMTVAQVGLPQRVTAQEAAHEKLDERVTALESDRETARQQRTYILTLLNWNNCAIEALDDDAVLRDVCGNRPQYIFGRLE